MTTTAPFFSSSPVAGRKWRAAPDEGHARKAQAPIHRALTTLCLLLLACTAQAQGTTGTPDISLHVAGHWGGQVNAAVVEGNRAYIANGRMFRILDLTDETNPVEMGALELGSQRVRLNATVDGVRTVKVRGQYAYVGAAGHNFLNIVDVSNPRLPNLVHALPGFSGSGTDNPLIAVDLELYGDYAYVAGETGSGGQLRIFDIRNPLNVAPVTTFNRPWSPMLIHEGKLIGRGPPGSTSPTITIHDLDANPTNPPQIGALNMNRNVNLRSLAVLGDHIYAQVQNGFGSSPPFGPIQAAQHGLVTVDISNPESPIITNIQAGSDIRMGVRFDSFKTRMMAVDGRLYMGDHFSIDAAAGEVLWRASHGLRIYDLATNPAQPSLVGSYKHHGEIPMVLAATEDRAYVADTAEGFVIVDVSNPQWPEGMGKFHSPGVLRKMTLGGAHLYVSDSYGGFTILDITNSSQPAVIGYYLARRYRDHAIEGMGIEKMGDVVYLAAGHSGLISVGVSNPVQPRTLGLMRIQDLESAFVSRSRFFGLSIENSVAYLGFYAVVPGGSGRFFVTSDVSDSSAPVISGSAVIPPAHPFYKLPDTIIATQGGLVFLGGGSGSILEVNDPASPEVISSGYGVVSGASLAGAATLLNTAWNSSIAPYGEDDAWAQNDGLYIWDVSDPVEPTMLRWIKHSDPVPGCGTFPWGAVGVAVASGTHRAYIRTVDAIFILDVTTPSDPVCLHRIALADGVHDGVHDGSSTSQGSPPFARFADLLIDEPGRAYTTSESLGLTILEIQGLESTAAATRAGE